MSEQQLLNLISSDLKTPIEKEEIFSPEIKISHLKKIDKIFNKGLSYYVDPEEPPQDSRSSIFFRKKKFNSELNLRSKQVVSEFEDFKFSLSAIASLSNIKTDDRKLPVYSVKNSPQSVCNVVREILYPAFNHEQKEFLKSLINILGSYNILVLEFIENWNLTEKANIDGFFINPNIIVLKRQPGKSFKREILTLAHELAHYLINVEEVEKIDFNILGGAKLSAIENWCHDFAFYFLIGEYQSIFDNISFCKSENDYNHDDVAYISKHTHLSELALYTRLFINDKISAADYRKIYQESERLAKLQEEEERRIKEEEKLAGKERSGGRPVPINSNLLINTLQVAYNEGVIDEYEMCKTLKIPPDKLSNYI